VGFFFVWLFFWLFVFFVFGFCLGFFCFVLLIFMDWPEVIRFERVKLITDSRTGEAFRAVLKSFRSVSPDSQCRGMLSLSVVVVDALWFW